MPVICMAAPHLRTRDGWHLIELPTPWRQLRLHGSMTEKRDEMAMDMPPNAGHDGEDAHVRFEQFVRSQYGRLIRFLRRRNSPERAEEIAQDSIVHLLHYREKVREDEWKPLLYRIAINQAVRYCRRETVRMQQDGGISVERIAGDAPLPDEEAERVERVERLQAAILALPPKCRRVYLLRHANGLSHASIAARCGISTKMVEKHLAIALQHLQRQIGSVRSGGL